MLSKQEFELLYNSLFVKVYNFFYFSVMNRTEAEDLTSISFLKLYLHLNEYDSEKALPQTYLFRIAQNTLTDYYRTRRNYVSLDEIDSLPAEEKNSEDKIMLMQLLEQLSEKERRVLYCRYKLELTAKETADIMNISVTSVTTLCSRALKKSKKNYEKLFSEGVTNSDSKTYIFTQAG
jgi:RNA polymerase sigma-70 factor (ECF subfamily)